MTPPRLDPTPLFELYRGSYRIRIVDCRGRSFPHLRPLRRRTEDGRANWRTELGLAPRPASVLLTALRAFGLLDHGRR